MSKEQKNIPNAENPETFTGLKLGKPKDMAAGIPAVISSAKHMLAEMGPARAWKALAELNQKDGYDCPGCAWPDPDGHRSAIAEYCENGAKAIAEEATTKKCDPEFFAKNSVYELSQLTDYQIGKSGRVTEPMYLPKGATHYQPISWQDAFNKIGKALNELNSPNEAVFYTSGRTSNEAAFLYQLFVREYGTNNLPDCSNMCHESSGVALNESVGIGKGSVKLEDFYEAEVIIILGQNPGTNHPRMLSALQKAKENGATIISVNPLPETGLISFANPQEVKGALGIKARLTDIFLQVKINGDMALLKAIGSLLLQAEEQNPGSVFDHEFIKSNTLGYDEYIASLKKHNNIDQLAEACGISVEQIKQTAEVLKNKKKIIACWAMGLTQHKNAVATIREVVNLLLVKGSIGKPGAGTCPVRGHSNVQGDRTMGIFEKPPKALLESIERTYGFKPPHEHGYDVVDAIKAMHEGKAKVFIAMGGNFLSATPDTEYTADALRKTTLTVQVSTKLNRSHLVHGEEAIILPTYGRSDKDMMNGKQQFVSCENSMGVVQMSKGNLKPISDKFMSEPAIVANLAKATLKESKVNWDLYLEDYDYIRNDIELVIPGFDSYNQRVRQLGGFYLPNGARMGKFNTLQGKAMFNAADVTYNKLADDELLMMTIRSHDQFNTTIYGLDDRYRGITNERRVIFMNEEDIKKHGVKAGDIVDLYNYHGGVERVAHRFIIIPFSIPQGSTATYFPETNVLVPIDSTADKSNTPTSKYVVLKIRKSS